MIKKIFIALLVFYLLIALQTSFLSHFFNYLPNLTLILLCFINFFERQKDNFGIFSAFFGGLFLDIFFESPLKFFGYYVLISLFLAIFIKFFLKNYIKPYVRPL